MAQATIHLNVSCLEGLGPDPRDVSIYRIVQESLLNAIRHGGATEISVEFRRPDNSIEMVLTDNGHGFDPAASTGAGMGLAIMGERARAAGGDLQVRSAVGKGTTITARIPVPQGRAQDS